MKGGITVKKIRKLMFLLLLMMLSTVNLPYINHAEGNEEDDYDYVIELKVIANMNDPMISGSASLIEQEPEYCYFTATSSKIGEDKWEVTQDKYGNDSKFYYTSENGGVEITITAFNSYYIYSSHMGNTSSDLKEPQKEDYGYTYNNKEGVYYWDGDGEAEYNEAYQLWVEAQGVKETVVNGWIIQMDESGQVMTISRADRKINGEGYQSPTVIEFWISKEPPNYAYSQLDHIDVFAGEHGQTQFINQDPNDVNNNVYLVTNSIVGQRPEKNVTTIIDKIKYYIARFKEPIFLFTSFLYGIAIFTTMLGIAINTFKLATSSSHPVYRRDAVINLLTSFICASLLGGIVLFSKLIMDICF